MPVNTENPVYVFGYFKGNLNQALGQFCQLLLALFAKLGRTAGEQNFGLKDKSVTDDMYSLALAQHFTQASEKFRSITGKFLNFAGQG